MDRRARGLGAVPPRGHSWLPAWSGCSPIAHGKRDRLRTGWACFWGAVNWHSPRAQFSMPSSSAMLRYNPAGASTEGRLGIPERFHDEVDLDLTSDVDRRTSAGRSAAGSRPTVSGWCR
jgi:hypothetical protein